MEDFIEQVKAAMGHGESAPYELTLHIQTAIAYMKGAGVSEDAMLSNPLAVGCAAIGANDIWQTDSGTIKFSPIFTHFIAQLRR